jgi:3-isopropylmalate/(R)-2-methylmalate dehydratase small subunit
MNTLFCGKAWLFGDHVDTDIIIPSRFLVTDDEQELGTHVFSDHMQGFSSKVSKGDILVAGRNFGCGSSREHAPLALRGSGISCIVAESYARTFFRNCINRGFYAIELPGAIKRIRQEDTLEINIERGIIINRTSCEEYAFAPFPAFIQEICEQEGLFPYIQKRLNAACR